MKLCNYTIADWTPPFVIAELGSNHNGDMELARQLIDAAKRAGAHCVKFQSWSKETIFSRSVYQSNHFLKDDYRNRNDYTLEQIVDEFSISEQELVEMRDYCRQVGMGFSSTPFSWQEADFLVDVLEADYIKIASMDCVNYPFLAYCASKQVPIVLSTGFCTLAEIDQAVQTIEQAGNREIALLHCVANYPPRDEDVHLNNIDMLRANYPDYPVGFSDHSIGTAIPLAAIAKGSSIIEKHFTLDKSMFGWDHKVSATEEEMRVIVEDGRRICTALGSFRRVRSAKDEENMQAFRRSIVAVRDIPAGAEIAREDLDFKRPGTGLQPADIDLVVGRVARRSIAADQVLSIEDI